jgi:hypothetical protein
VAYKDFASNVRNDFLKRNKHSVNVFVRFADDEGNIINGNRLLFHPQHTNVLARGARKKPAEGKKQLLLTAFFKKAA